MKCPHCLEGFFEQWLTPANKKDYAIDIDKRGTFWGIRFCHCPNCHRIIIQLGKAYRIIESTRLPSWGEWILIEPKAISRAPLPPQVPPKFADDYKKACLTIVDSPEASAALSRRVLQNLLREKAGITKKKLFDEIEEVINSKKLPSYLSEALDAVRNIGNFAAHPIKSKITGKIVEVEPGEAEWNLDILEGLFDFYFVQPEILKKKKEKLNRKLKDAGKSPMK